MSKTRVVNGQEVDFYTGVPITKKKNDESFDPEVVDPEVVDPEVVDPEVVNE